MSSYYTGMILLCILACLLMCLLIGSSPLLPRVKKKQFSVGFVIVAIGALLEWLSLLLENTGSRIWFHTGIKALELMIAPLIPLALMVPISGKRKLLNVMHVGFIVNAILIAVSCFTKSIFYFDRSNVYHHGKLYFIFIASYVFQGLCLVYGAYSIRKEYRSKNSWILYLTFLYLLVGIGLHNIDSSIRSDYLTLTITPILFYISYIDLIQSCDSLTKLLNRNCYDGLVSRMDEACIIITIDVDYFKQCNDNYGHLYGDEVLKIVSKVISTNAPKKALCYRTGGDEFCIVVPGRTNNPDSILEKLHASMEEVRATDSRIPFISTGYAAFHPEGDSMIDTIENADAMMYRFKNLRKQYLAEGKVMSFSEIQRILISTPIKEMKSHTLS